MIPVTDTGNMNLSICKFVSWARTAITRILEQASFCVAHLTIACFVGSALLKSAMAVLNGINVTQALEDLNQETSFEYAGGATTSCYLLDRNHHLNDWKTTCNSKTRPF